MYLILHYIIIYVVINMLPYINLFTLSNNDTMSLIYVNCKEWVEEDTVGSFK